MKKLQTIKTILAIIILTAMCSCTKSTEQAIAGKWKVVKEIGGGGDFDNTIFEFKSDGYFAFYDYDGYDGTYCAPREGTYSVNENNIEIKFPNEVIAGTIQEISNDKLTLNLLGEIHLEFVRTNETINFHL